MKLIALLEVKGLYNERPDDIVVLLGEKTCKLCSRDASHELSIRIRQIFNEWGPESREKVRILICVDLIAISQLLDYCFRRASYVGAL